eukprot:907756-Amorphochlora_amoeboformis.AAC.2
MGDSKVASAGAEWKQILSPRGEYYFYNEAKDMKTERAKREIDREGKKRESKDRGSEGRDDREGGREANTGRREGVAEGGVRKMNISPHFYHTSLRITWDRPGELKAPSGEFKEHEGEWYWVPSSKEGYTPAKLVKKQKSGNWELETENGQSLTVSKKKLPLERLYWSHLKRVVQ